MRTDTNRGYNGYTIEAGERRILFGGDTALTDSFRSLKNRGPYDLAIMPVGAYDPWIHASRMWPCGGSARNSICNSPDFGYTCE